MNEWTLYQYKDIIDSFVAKCDKPTKVKIDQRMDELRQQGDSLEFPACAPLKNTNGLHELRAKKVRLLYCFDMNNQIIFVYAYKKPVQTRYNAQAETNRQRILSEEVKLHVIN